MKDQQIPGAEALTDDQLEDLLLPLMRKHLDTKAFRWCTREQMKDGIEIDRVTTGMLSVARDILAAALLQPVAGEPRNVEGMTRSEFERHLRLCYQHDNARDSVNSPDFALTATQERSIAERVERNYPSKSYDYSPRCTGCAAFDSEASHVDFVQGCEGCKARMQKIAGFGPLWGSAPIKSVADEQRTLIERAANICQVSEHHYTANQLRALLASHPTNQPEPRGEVTDDDERDAERYRFLKSIPFGPDVPPLYRGIAFSFAVTAGKPGFIRSCRGEEMDAAIDAARAGESR